MDKPPPKDKPPTQQPTKPGRSPYDPLPGENIQQYLRRVPGPLTIVGITPSPEKKPNYARAAAN